MLLGRIIGGETYKVRIKLVARAAVDWFLLAHSVGPRDSHGSQQGSCVCKDLEIVEKIDSSTLHMLHMPNVRCR